MESNPRLGLQPDNKVCLMKLENLGPVNLASSETGEGCQGGTRSPTHQAMNRRSFLAQTTMAAAAAALPRSASAAASGALRLGLTSAATYGTGGTPPTLGSNHGTAFSTTCNGWDEEKAKGWKGTFVRAKRRLEGARVMTVWDPDPAAARQLADICDIPRVADTPEAAC